MQQVFTRSYATGRELQRWGYKCTGICPWCGGLDSFFHRAWQCRRGEEALTEPWQRRVRSEAQRAGPGSLLYSCLWMAKPEMRSSGPKAEAVVRYVDAGGEATGCFDFEEGGAERHRYGEGSCYHGSSEALASAGWALAEVDDEGGLVRAAFGNVPRGGTAECQHGRTSHAYEGSHDEGAGQAPAR